MLAQIAINVKPVMAKSCGLSYAQLYEKIVRIVVDRAICNL